MRSLVFLDFDGVLNCATTKTRVGRFMGLDDRLIQNLNAILSQSDADVVISSSWREAFEIEALKMLLNERGFEHSDRIIGLTPSFTGSADEKLDMLWTSSMRNGRRHAEIELWLKKNGQQGQRFLVLDDMKTNFKENQILTDEYIGLLPDHVSLALDILSTGPTWEG